MPTACLDLLKIWCLFQDFSFSYAPSQKHILGCLFIVIFRYSLCGFQGAIHAVDLCDQQKGPGSHLLFHAVASIVSSADWVLTIVFGMGTGVSPCRIATGCLLSCTRHKFPYGK